MSLPMKSQNILTIEISDLNSNTGTVLLELNDGENKFIKGVTSKIINNACIITIENLKTGKYAFKFFHDENNNKELDTNWIGIPKEGFGFSNNAKGKFGPPAVEKTVFELKGKVNQKCTPTYY